MSFHRKKKAPLLSTQRNLFNHCSESPAHHTLLNILQSLACPLAIYSCLPMPWKSNSWVWLTLPRMSRKMLEAAPSHQEPFCQGTKRARSPLGRTCQPGTIPHCSQVAPGQSQHWASGTFLACPRMGTHLGRAHGRAGQGCGELQTDPVVASLWQRLKAPAVLGHGQGGGSPRGLDVGFWIWRVGRDRKAH